MGSPWFLDMLDVHQEHPSAMLPKVGAKAYHIVDLVTGEIGNHPFLTPIQEEGSYSSKLHVKCDGSRVLVRGNPSRWNRVDNLFGVATFDECVQIYNKVLSRIDLPPFTKCTKVTYRDNGTDFLCVDGAMLDRVDFTRNWIAGKGRVRTFLRGFSSQTIRKARKNNLPTLTPDGNTLSWGYGSQDRNTKLYNKEEELIRNRFKHLKGASPDDISYYNNVIKFCHDYGIAREEHSFKSHFFRREEHRSLRFYGLTTEDNYLLYLRDIDNAFKRTQIMHTNYETIADQLLMNNVCTNRQSANATQSYAMVWLHGQDIDKTKRQYFVHRARLLQIGIDIALPYDASRSSPIIRSSDIIELSIAYPPEWYRMPKAA